MSGGFEGTRDGSGMEVDGSDAEALHPRKMWRAGYREKGSYGVKDGEGVYFGVTVDTQCILEGVCSVCYHPPPFSLGTVSFLGEWFEVIELPRVCMTGPLISDWGGLG